MKRASFLTLLGAATGLAVSCSVYDASLLLEGEGGDGGATNGTSGSGNGVGGAAGGAAGSGGIGAVDGGGGGSEPCIRKTVPGPPRPEDVETPGGSIQFTVAMSSIDFGDDENDRFREVGFDLDLRCKPDEPASCRLPHYSRPEMRIDGPGGVDNALGALIKQVGTLLSGAFGSDQYNAQLEAGRISLLIRVSNYNGEPNDDQVTVAIYIAAPFDSFTQADGGTVRPALDGTDRWPVSSISLVDPGDGAWDINRPLFVDEFGYVSGGVIVGQLDAARLRIPVGLTLTEIVELEMLLRSAFTACNVEQVETAEGEGWALKNCTLAGIWKTDDLVQQLGRFPDPVIEAAPLCMDSPTYGTFRNTVCSFTDLRAERGTDAQPCDSISVGVEFETVPARLGNVFEFQPLEPRCAPDVDPANDSCASIDMDEPDSGTGGTGGTGGAGGTGGVGGSGGAGTAPDAGAQDAAADQSAGEADGSVDGGDSGS